MLIPAAEETSERRHAGRGEGREGGAGNGRDGVEAKRGREPALRQRYLWRFAKYGRPMSVLICSLDLRANFSLLYNFIDRLTDSI